MKFVYTLLILLTSSSIIAQESIGFTDSTDFEYLIDYRLPDWGYSNFYLSNVGLGINGRFDTREFERNFIGSENFQKGDNESRQYNFDLGISPAYELFRESEDLVIRGNSSILLSTNNRGSNIEDVNNNSGTISNNKREITSNQKSLGWMIDFEVQRYISSDFFVELDWRSNARFDFDNSSNQQNELTEVTSEFKKRSVYFEPNLGIGFGRIRNVTPILRALRLNERFKALGNNSLTQGDIELSAVQFTRYQGYERTYDRPKKYFWDDLNEGINQKLSNVDAFSLFYLDDVFLENLGARFEGYTITLMGGYSYSNNLSKLKIDDGSPLQRNFSITRAANIELDAIWYKNLDLNHQINVQFRNQLFFPLERINNIELSYNSTFNAGWLWLLADRFQLTNSLRVNYFRERLKDRNGIEEHNLLNSLSSQFSYFIENKLQLSAGLNLFHRHQSESSSSNSVDASSVRNSWNIGLSASVRYYFNRNLF